MTPSKYSDTVLSLAVALSAAVWGLYWIPLRAIQDVGMPGSWSVAFFNACPLVVLLPLLVFNFRSLSGVLAPTLLAGVLIGMAFTLYSNGLVETTVVRATMLYYLTPIWSTIMGVLWLSERLTKGRIVAIGVAIFGLFLLLSNGAAAGNPLNKGDLYSFLSGIFWAFGVATLNRWSNIPILPLAAVIFIATTTLSSIFAGVIYADPLPEIAIVISAFPAAAFWSVCVMLPCFCIIFRVSQFLFPGRVGILTMSEVIVAIGSAAILVPEETMVMLQWVGAAAILAAGLIEVVFGFRKSAPAG
jgi:drug/metabolite transporter (DMT)-like permease